MPFFFLLAKGANMWIHRSLAMDTAFVGTLLNGVAALIAMAHGPSALALFVALAALWGFYVCGIVFDHASRATGYIYIGG